VRARGPAVVAMFRSCGKRRKAALETAPVLLRTAHRVQIAVTTIAPISAPHRLPLICPRQAIDIDDGVGRSTCTHQINQVCATRDELHPVADPSSHGTSMSWLY